jgi:cytosine/adenosine deaminase-related metal-dependent hydrolase
MLLARVGRSLQPFGCDHGPADMTARDALRVATRGGAKVLGRDDIGQIAPGMAADLAIYDLRTLPMAGGAVHDPVASLLLTQPAQTAWTLVHGHVVADHGQITTVDLPRLIEAHNRMAAQLIAA